MTRKNRSGVDWSDRAAINAYKREQRARAGKKTRLTQADWKRIYDAYGYHLSFTRVARDEGVSVKTVSYIIRHFGYRKR